MMGHAQAALIGFEEQEQEGTHLLCFIPKFPWISGIFVSKCIKLIGGWRARRAELLAGSEAGWAAQLARNSNPAFKGVDVWCHALDTPETGAVLIADPKMGHFQQHYFAQCVILILEHGEQGTLGVILNRPTPFSLGAFVHFSSRSALWGAHFR